MKYGHEIDGLRAIAVAPVILFHARFGLFSGGFVGVDVFFVISGYLITSLIRNDVQKTKFTTITFYEHKARQISSASIFCNIEQKLYL
jgi:peptidoglycan/LPS O-acetylase OafA/YrhL